MYAIQHGLTHTEMQTLTASLWPDNAAVVQSTVPAKRTTEKKKHERISIKAAIRFAIQLSTLTNIKGIALIREEMKRHLDQPTRFPGNLLIRVTD